MQNEMEPWGSWIIEIRVFRPSASAIGRVQEVLLKKDKN